MAGLRPPIESNWTIPDQLRFFEGRIGRFGASFESEVVGFRPPIESNRTIPYQLPTTESRTGQFGTRLSVEVVNLKPGQIRNWII